MDQMMIDVTDFENVVPGELVALFGDKRQGTAISAADVVLWSDTIDYEIFCGISKRVPRLYN